MKNRIRTGKDRRTTVMIKNVPNKYSKSSLLQLIDHRLAGKYDFFYLPIDFRNKCNLGYAFVNMKDPLSIVQLVEEFSGKRWCRFKSDKVCEVVYARLQGKHSLMEHFRSSRLMNKHQKYRPLVLDDNGNLCDDISFPSLHGEVSMQPSSAWAQGQGGHPYAGTSGLTSSSSSCSSSSSSSRHGSCELISYLPVTSNNVLSPLPNNKGTGLGIDTSTANSLRHTVSLERSQRQDLNRLQCQSKVAHQFFHSATQGRLAPPAPVLLNLFYLCRLTCRHISFSRFVQRRSHEGEHPRRRRRDMWRCKFLPSSSAARECGRKWAGLEWIFR